MWKSVFSYDESFLDCCVTIACKYSGRFSDEQKNLVFSDKNFSIAQFHHLHVFKLSAVDGKAYQCAHLVETIVACRTGVDVEHVECLVVFHLQDV